MKVAIFAPLFGKVGVEEAMTSLARELTALGTDVELIKTAREWSSQDSQPTPGVTTHRFITQRFFSRLPARGWLIFRITSLAVSLASVISLTIYLLRKRPDVMIAAMMPTTAILAKMISRSNTSLIVSVQGFPRPGLLRKLVWKLLWPSSDAIVTESNDLKDAFVKISGISPKRISTIYNPHLNPAARVLSGSDPVLLRNTPNSEFLVVGVGRLTRQKGFDTLIQAIKIASADIDVTLLILGEGELRAKLEQLVVSTGLSSRVMLPGHVDNPYPYIKCADVVVVSSLWEGLARVPVEAQNLGTPVLATRIPGGVQEILMNGEAGLLVEKNDPADMAAGILSLCSDPDLRERLTSTALENIERFEPSRCAQQYHDLIKTLRH